VQAGAADSQYGSARIGRGCGQLDKDVLCMRRWMVVHDCLADTVRFEAYVADAGDTEVRGSGLKGRTF
jgi:hypothetical protein